MPQLRQDPITGRRVLISTERAGRPQQFAPAPIPAVSLDCPFCAGHEAMTPPAVLEVPDPAAPDRWRVRVIPNKYPAVSPEPVAPARNSSYKPEALAREARCASSELSSPALRACGERAVGAHEVIVETPDHARTITALSEEHFADVLAAYRSRMRFWKARRAWEIASVLVFKNNGPQAGASLEHAHSQLIALPWVPATLAEELSGAEARHAQDGGCVFCQLVARERAEGTRIVAEGQDFLAFCPFAGRFPFETWILPKSHASHFESSRGSLAELASLVLRIIGRMETLAPGLAYNYWIHSAPPNRLELASYHWHIEIAPRLATLAGFELGGGWNINPVAPEDAALALRL
jgi:UDPglucose--hexose-1-phosphate uridylyltransferase